MKIIMNPPYNGNLHLKILQEAMKYGDEIVNLSPIRWLQDPLAEYKKNSDFKKFEDIRKRIEDIEEVPATEAQRLFGSAQYENLGIYTLGKGGANISPKPFISQALFDKVKSKKIFFIILTLYSLLKIYAVFGNDLSLQYENVLFGTQSYNERLINNLKFRL